MFSKCKWVKDEKGFSSNQKFNTALIFFHIPVLECVMFNKKNSEKKNNNYHTFLTRFTEDTHLNCHLV